MAVIEKGTGLFFLPGVVFLMVMFWAVCAPAADLADCAKMDNPDERLACYDTLSGRTKQSVSGTVSEESKEESHVHPDRLTVMEKHWDLNPQRRKRVFVLAPYRPNYFLPVAYNSSPNEDTALEYDPDAKAQHTEAKFQLSFKAKVWEDVFGKNVDIWMAYTQQSFWQVYNKAFSSPFRDTNYEPEMLINFRTRYEIPGLQGLKLQFVNVGFNHQSNGRSKPLSRSWNRIVANFGLEKDNFNLLLKTWYHLPEDEFRSDNADLTRYMGYGELWVTYFYRDIRFTGMLRNNLRQNNLGAGQLDVVVPMSVLWNRLSNKFGLYVQYFNGYGEGMMDYNTNTNRISAGVMLIDWNWDM
jgi:phospholipase A1